MQLAVVIPALDEADRIRAAIESARAPGVEVLVVDGGSRDATREVARAAGARVLVSEPGRVVMRRTQTFHPILQEGLLKSLAERSDQILCATVRYVHSTMSGDEYDEYEISWD